MRFSTLFFTLASVGAAFAAVDAPVDGAGKIAKRDDFREAVKRSAEPQSWGGFGKGDPFGNPWWVGTCDADNDCPRVCRENFGQQFNDEGTKCCFNKCSCSGGCNNNGGRNECDADNDCPRVCRERYGVEVNTAGSKCCNTNCNCYSNSCGNNPWGGNPWGGNPWGNDDGWNKGWKN